VFRFYGGLFHGGVGIMRRGKIAILVGLCFIVLSCTDKASTETDKAQAIDNKAAFNVMPRELVYYA
jgi:hypothetical protein